MAERQFKIGDVVDLKGIPGRPMPATDVLPGSARCFWFDNSERGESGTFPFECLHRLG